MFNLARILICLTVAVTFNSVKSEKVRVVELDKIWTLRNQNGTIELAVAKIPSGVYTVLSPISGDVLQSENDVNLRWIAYENWTYTRIFNVTQADYEHVRSVNLTLHGVDTVATIRLNKVIIGTTENMFVRYSFDVLPYLQQQNTLEIELMSPVLAAKERANALNAKNITAPPDCPDARTNGECHRNMLRKMQASFGSDWSLAAPSLGIWKSVVLEYYDVAIMRDIDVALKKNDSYWSMDIRVFLSTGIDKNFYGELTFYAPNLLNDRLNISRRVINNAYPIIEFNVDIPKDNVLQWWPNGYGDQTLYPLFFSMNCWLEPEGPKLRSKTVSQKSLKIGFRTVELVEDIDDYGRTFYFKVNGYPIFMKGANFMPSHILPELSAEQDRIKHILQSAKDSHMNMIRVWGGGFYESDYFYSLADTYGILVWQDMAFTTATYPITDDFVDAIRREIAQNAKRIAYHPSLVFIVTNDETELYLIKNKTDFGKQSERLEEEYQQLFMGTVKHELNIISRIGFSPRPGPMMSTPSMGIEENKKDLPQDPQNVHYGDVHFWENDKDGWDPSTYPCARFVSEYGFQSLPIMASWNRSLGRTDTIASLMRHRQHDEKGFNPMMQLIVRHLPFHPQDWEDNIEAFIYFSQVAQAVAVKTATELFRSQRVNNRTMGALYWQLNDNWVAPSWSSIDFYGNYKLLYYWSKDFLAPTSIIALFDSKNRAINLTMMRDDITDYQDARIFNVSMNTYLWSELYPKKTITWKVILNSNSIQQRILPLDTIIVEQFSEENCFLEFVLSEADKIHSKTYFFPRSIARVTGMMDPQLTIELSWFYCNDDVISTGRNISYSLTIRIKRPALFVYIEINHPQIVKYTLSHNGFVQVEPVKIIHLEYTNAFCNATISMENIKVLTVNQFMDRTSTTTSTSTVSSTTAK